MRMNLWLFLLLVYSAAARGDDLAVLLRDRAAIERVYYNHRLGQKPPFEQATPPALIEERGVPVLAQTQLRTMVICTDRRG